MCFSEEQRDDSQQLQPGVTPGELPGLRITGGQSDEHNSSLSFIIAGGRSSFGPVMWHLLKHDTVICCWSCLEGIQGWGVLAWARLICFGWIPHNFKSWHLALGDPSPADCCRFVSTATCRKMDEATWVPLVGCWSRQGLQICVLLAMYLYSMTVVGCRDKIEWREVKYWTAAKTKYPKGWPHWR